MKRPLKRHGGKHYQAPQIIELMGPHLHYVEPYCGAASVLLSRPQSDWLKGHPDFDGSAKFRGCSELINDVDGSLIAFWRTLQDPALFEQFQRRLEVTPFSQDEFRDALARDSLAQDPLGQDTLGQDTLGQDTLGQDTLGQDTGDVVDRAVAFFVRARQSRQALGRDFATMSRKRTRGGINEQVNSWLSAIDGLPEIHARLRSVVVRNDDAVKVIRDQDGPYTLYYCDPPYVHETRTARDAYNEHEMDTDQHRELLDTLVGIEGKFMLSGYHNQLYDDWAAANGFLCVETRVDNKASNAKRKEIKTECLWLNYSPTAAASSAKVGFLDRV